MKPFFVLIFTIFCIGCTTTAKIGPTPNIKPSQQSNAATQQNVKVLQQKIKDLQAALKQATKSGQQGDKNLEIVADDLNKLLREK